MSGPPLVFVVDDEEPVRDALRRLCTSLGYAVEVFPNAEALFDSHRLHAATCVVLDLQLPGLNGLDVQRRLAEIGAHLLALWGLPFPVTAAVAAHHRPPRGDAAFDEVTATYAANVLIEEAESALDPTSLPSSDPDLEWLGSSRLAPRLPEWREIARAVVEGSR